MDSNWLATLDARTLDEMFDDNGMKQDDFASASKNNTSVDEVKQFIKNQEKINTRRSTERDVKNFHNWLLSEHMDMRDCAEIPASELNKYLASFIINVRRQDGLEYEPDSLTNIKHSINRYLKERECTFTLFDRDFNLFQEALKAKRVELTKQGKGNRPNASEPLSREEQEKCWEMGIFGNIDASTLQFTVWFLMTIHFGFRGRDEHRKLCWGDVQLINETDGSESLIVSKARGSKTRDGADPTHTDRHRTTPKCVAIGGNRCLINLYKQYRDSRPAEACKDDSPFYIQAIPINRIKTGETVIYYATPMGKNTLGKLLKNACEKANIPGRKTNHGARKTCVKMLKNAGIDDRKIIKITRHKDPNSLRPYDDELSSEDHKKMSQILDGYDSSIDTVSKPINPCPPATAVTASAVNMATVSTSSTLSAPMSVIPHGSVFNNCTFNFKMPSSPKATIAVNTSIVDVNAESLTTNGECPLKRHKALSFSQE